MSSTRYNKNFICLPIFFHYKLVLIVQLELPVVDPHIMEITHYNRFLMD